MPHSDESPHSVFYSAESYTSEESVGALLKGILESIVTQADRRLVAHGLTHAQWAPLFRLAQGDCGTAAELARAMHSDPGAVTRAIDRLEAKGLVARVRSQEDRRIVNLRLTDAGAVVTSFVPSVLAEVFNLHLAGFSTDEWRALMGMLRRMRANGDGLRDTNGGDLDPFR